MKDRQTSQSSPTSACVRFCTANVLAAVPAAASNCASALHKMNTQQLAARQPAHLATRALPARERNTQGRPVSGTPSTASRRPRSTLGEPALQTLGAINPRPTPCSVRPVSRCGFAPRPRTSVVDPPPVRLHNCTSGRASFAKHALEPNPSGGAAQWGARAEKADTKWLQ